MYRPRLARAMRIAWTAFWGVAAVLLVVLWVRSYWWTDFLMPSSRAGVVSATGSLICIRDSPLDWPLGWTSIRPDANLVEATRSEASLNAIIVMYCWLVLGTLLLASSPWLMRKRFTTRTLLIATTLVAVGLGLMVWSTRG